MDSYLQELIHKLRTDPTVENARSLRIYINTFFAPFDPRIDEARKALTEFWTQRSIKLLEG